jgi:hypothetical protein
LDDESLLRSSEVRVSDVMWVALLSTAFLLVMFIRAVIATYKRIDNIIADGLADIDRDAWEAEMKQ